jgi:hypothetical protein
MYSKRVSKKTGAVALGNRMNDVRDNRELNNVEKGYYVYREQNSLLHLILCYGSHDDLSASA